ncbi:MAG: zinc-ribbon domain containing protein [Candidatus Eremiobacteraeota bacterium]|nr:zinc-ribbon domain containing protein [Candidatus Eremiobacteraeota bacterium]MBC5826344.1 zinc-ribbon domain containing protein [Candidatus Eremiobacteraeota bacterium]
MFTDQLLTCIDCGQEFTFTAGEQEFFSQKGFQNKPSRCGDCRQARKASRGNGGSTSSNTMSDRPRYGAQREMFKVTCSECGNEAEVPFQPRGDKPVYCRDCFQKQRSYQR